MPPRGAREYNNFTEISVRCANCNVRLANFPYRFDKARNRKLTFPIRRIINWNTSQVRLIIHFT